MAKPQAQALQSLSEQELTERQKRTQTISLTLILVSLLGLIYLAFAESSGYTLIIGIMVLAFGAVLYAYRGIKIKEEISRRANEAKR